MLDHNAGPYPLRTHFLRKVGIEVKTGDKSNGERLTVLTKRG
jgi:hypothetical protein